MAPFFVLISARFTRDGPRYIVIKWSPFGGARTARHYITLLHRSLAHARTTYSTQAGLRTRPFALLLFTIHRHAIPSLYLLPVTFVRSHHHLLDREIRGKFEEKREHRTLRA